MVFVECFLQKKKYILYTFEYNPNSMFSNKNTHIHTHTHSIFRVFITFTHIDNNNVHDRCPSLYTGLFSFLLFFHFINSSLTFENSSSFNSNVFNVCICVCVTCNVIIVIIITKFIHGKKHVIR